jgi:molecular chaperone DnaK (HSP70)
MIVIGIDLGTTNTVVAVWKDGKAIIIPNDEGHRVTPSIVAFTATDILVGDVAKSQVKFNIQNFISTLYFISFQSDGEECQKYGF